MYFILLYLCTHKMFHIMKALIIFTLLLLVAAIVVFEFFVCALSSKVENLHDELELTKEFVSNEKRRSLANYTCCFSERAGQHQGGGTRTSARCEKQKYDVSERRALYKQLRDEHSIKETASLMDISMRTARRCEDYIGINK